MTYPNYPFNYGYNPQFVQNQQQQPQQPQNSIVGVSSENEARAYPVGINTSVTFRDESQPNTFYTKTMGSSPLDSPTFECYKLVKIDSVSNALQAKETPDKKEDIDLSVYALKDDFKGVYDRINGMQKEINNLREKFKKRIMREVDEDDE